MVSTAQLVLSHLESYQLKRERGNQYRSKKSPLRGTSSDSNAFTLTIEDDEHGAWTDFVAQQSGSLYELADILGVPRPKPADKPDVKQAENTKRPYRDLAEYAAAHGVEAYVFETAKWECVTHQGRPALVYPTQTGKRVRFIDGQQPYYKAVETGYRNCWYGLKVAVERAKSQNNPLIICNGEPSVVVAQSFGLPACAVTGGEKKFSDDLLAELRNVWNGAVVLAFDCDDTGRKAAADIALQLSDHQVKIVDLKLSKGGDLADFCKLQGDDSYKAFWKLQDSTPEHKPPVEQLRDSAVTTLDARLKELSRAITTGLNQPDIEQIAAKAQAEITRLMSATAKPLIRTSASVADEALSYLKERFNNPHLMPGIPTGFPPLDKVMGGLRPGTVTVFYGATSMGKSTMIASVFRNLWEKCSGLIVSTEMEPKNYMLTLAAAMLRIPVERMETGSATGGITEAEYQQITGTLIALKAAGWTWLDSSNPNASQLRSAVLDAACNPTFKIVMVDSISNMFNAGDYTSVVDVNNTIQQLARATKAAFVLTSQVSREMDKRPEGKKIPLLSDAYGGGVIENNADTVAALYRHDYYVQQQLEKPNELYPPNTGALILRKTRGRGGMGKVMRMAYVGGAGFYPMARQGEEERL